MIELHVVGIPAPQGSKRGFPGKDGKVVLVEGGSKTGREKVGSWRQDVIDACQRWITAHASEVDGEQWSPLEGPVSLRIVFLMPRPKSVPKARRGRPATYPDLGKLTRATEDALKLGRIYKDDGQVCIHQTQKRYVESDETTGAWITVQEMGSQ